MLILRIENYPQQSIKINKKKLQQFLNSKETDLIFRRKSAKRIMEKLLMYNFHDVFSKATFARHVTYIFKI